MRHTKFSRLTCLLLAVVFLFSTMTVGVSAVDSSPYRDVSPSAWYYSDVVRAYEEKLMDGVGNNCFDPNGTLTREQYITILARFSGCDLSAYGNERLQEALDVVPGSWYAPAVAWAYENGLTSGVSSTAFGVGQPVTREQMATFIYRYVEMFQLELVTASDATSAFPDKNKVSDWAAEAVEAMRQAGIFHGDENCNFNPKNSAKRSEAATVFCNFEDAILDAATDTDGDGICDIDEKYYGSDPYVADDIVTDTDKDGLTDYIETYVTKTNKRKADTDGDGLTDYQEAMLTNTDPLLMDTDGNGLTDFEDDADSDGLTNGTEVALGTDPLLTDTDTDGLSDREEYLVQHTDPLNPDTDGDGGEDGWEVENGYDPLSFDATFAVTAEEYSTDSDVAVSVELELSGDPSSLQITETTACGLLDETTPGYIGSAFNFSVDADFDSATITFAYDPSALDANADPTIYYLNEETQLLEPLETTISNGIATAEVTHFSTYVLLDRKTVEQVWESQILAPGAVSSSDSVLDIVFVIDYSASMDDNDPEYLRLSIVNQFIDKLRDNQDQAAVVKFAAYATTLVPLTTDKEMLKNGTNSITNTSSDSCSNSEAGTNGTDGIHAALEQLKGSNGTSKYIIFLTDGEDTTSSYDYNELTNEANQNNIVIYTIGMGDADETQLSSIASTTGGSYYFANAVDLEDTSAGSLMDAFSDIENSTIDRELDSNGDGLSDYYTRLLCEGKLRTGTGIALFAGISYDEVQARPDYDNDGVLNGDEVIVTYDADTDKTYIMVVSSPVNADTDGDGILDDTDTAPRTKGLAGGIIGEVMLVACKGSNISTVILTFGANTGHSWITYHSYVNDELDFSEFNRGFSRSSDTGTWTDSTEDSSVTNAYQMSSDDYVTWGAGGIYLADAKSAVYNIEVWKHYSEEFQEIQGHNYSYATNAYLTVQVTQQQLDAMLSEFGKEANNDYNLVANNCTHVVLNVWNHVFGTSLDPVGLNTPTNLYSYLARQAGVAYNFNMDNIQNAA
jgi:uncharacterized protein YegL